MAVDEKDRSSAAFLSFMESGEDPPVMTVGWNGKCRSFASDWRKARAEPRSG